ncbi:unnamed protein product, partial [Meganyctiphanes norvegica]
QISTAERQVFDFLGHMWLPIIANFFNFIFVIFGFFGAYQYRTKYTIIYFVWLFVWVGWNAFVICFYLDIGVLDNSRDWLNFGTGSASWWEVNGLGCKAIYPTNLTNIDPFRPIRPQEVTNCLVEYVYVETIHASIQCVFGFMGLCVSLYLIKVFSHEEKTCKSKKVPTTIYSVEYSPQREGSESPELGIGDSPYHQQSLTPRRVKRQQRNRASGRSQGGTIRTGTGTQGRNSRDRNSQRRNHQYLNPVNRLMDHANESSTTDDTYHPNNVNARGGANNRGNHHPPGPMIGGIGGRQGHSNPMYVHSRPNSTYSVNSGTSNSPPGTDPSERPPSVHSSYSNYHGVRTSINPNPYGRPPTIPPGAAMVKTGLRGRSNIPNNIIANGTNNSNSTVTTTTSVGSFGSMGSIRTINNGTIGSTRERPPPYMFGVNSETVI